MVVKPHTTLAESAVSITATVAEVSARLELDAPLDKKRALKAAKMRVRAPHLKKVTEQFGNKLLPMPLSRVVDELEASQRYEIVTTPGMTLQEAITAIQNHEEAAGTPDSTKSTCKCKETGTGLPCPHMCKVALLGGLAAHHSCTRSTVPLRGATRRSCRPEFRSALPSRTSSRNRQTGRRT